MDLTKRAGATIELMCDLQNGDRGRKATARLGELMWRRAQRCGAVRGAEADPTWLAALFGVRTIEKTVALTKSGRLERDGSGYRIYLRAGTGETEQRRRFSLAHEVAHIFYAETRGIETPNDDVVYSAEEEKRCDLFAESFLMPRTLFRENYQQLAKEKASILDCVRALASEFNVTPTAVVQRLKSLDCLKNSGIMILVAEQAIDCWKVVGSAGDRPAFHYLSPATLEQLSIKPPRSLLRESRPEKSKMEGIRLSIWGRPRRGMPRGLDLMPCAAEYGLLSHNPPRRVIIGLRLMQSLARAEAVQEAISQLSFGTQEHKQTDR